MVAIIRVVIRVLARENPSDRFVTVDPDTLGTLKNYDLVWVDIESSDPAEISSVLSTFGFEELTQNYGERDYFHVVDERTHSIRLMLSAPQISPDARLAHDPIHVLIGRRILITDHDDPVPSIERLFSAEAVDVHGADSPAVLAAILSQSSARELIPYIEELEVRIDALEGLALASDPRTLTESHVLRRDLITLRRISGRLRDVLEDLSESVHHAIGADGRLAFARSAEYTQRVVESLDSARNLLSSAIDTYRGAVADQTNEIVRLLTVFSAILLPLTLLAGIYGMNFVEIPTSKEPWGFWATIGAMLLLAAVLWIYFVRRGFVGGPKLRDLPKSVGLGIVAVGTAPVKAIASGVGSTVKYLDPRHKSEEPDSPPSD